MEEGSDKRGTVTSQASGRSGGGVRAYQARAVLKEEANALVLGHGCIHRVSVRELVSLDHLAHAWHRSN